jgi:ABC-2 type transport system ATP-binding protein
MCKEQEISMQSDNQTVLKIENVCKRYKDNEVINDVSLTLNAGELFGLIGLNGVGKTTLIKVVLDLIKADSGTATIHGIPSTNTLSRRHVAYVPEKFQPSRYLTGKEFLQLSASYYGHKMDYDRAVALAESLALDPKALQQRVGSYSKGMGQKLGLLGACLTDQPLLILDEPMSGLDPKARILLKKLMLEMKAAGRTLFFSSHILSDIDEICDRIGIIHDKQMVYDGTPAAFKKQYPKQSLEQAFLSVITKEAA